MKGIYDELEQKLRAHALLKKQIQNRKLELEFPETYDSNTTAVQTSNSNSDPTGILVEKWEMDEELIILKRRYATIQKFLNDIDSSHKIILEMRYMSREVHSWEVIAKRVGYSQGSCRRIRKQCLDELGNYLAWET